MTAFARLVRPWWAAAALGILILTGGCQERLTEPVDCPALCPGGEQPVLETVLTAVPDRDSSFPGYVEAGSAVSLLVSNGLGPERRALYRFVARQDSVSVADTNRGYLVDSVAITVNVLARDTLLDGLRLVLYRVSTDLDEESTFDEVAAQLTDANLIDTVEVADTLNAGGVQLVLRGADVLKTGLPLDAGGPLAIGVAIAAPQPTGLRIGALASATGATFASYVTAQNVPDTVSGRRQTLTPRLEFNTHVSPEAFTPDPDLLTLGGTPSSRALVRFDLPDPVEDSANIVRATLELIPAQPILGLPSDPALLIARAVLADLGAKSPVADDASSVSSDTLSPGVSDTVRLDVTNIVRTWQLSEDRPDAIFLSLRPEGGSFMRPEFGSTRAPGVGAPRLRITYMRAFPFEEP